MKVKPQNILNNFFSKIEGRLVKNLRYHNYRNRTTPPPFADLNALVINVTTRCNFNCPHCLRKPLDAAKTLKIDMPIELFEEILKGAKKLGYKKINFTGGEAILHPQFKKLVELACRYGYYYTIVSNGWLYHKYWPIISENKRLLSIAFSVDGATAEVHDRVRNQPGSFEQVIEAIKFYKERGQEVVMATCLTPQNQHQISEIISLAQNLKVDVINLFAPVSISDKPNNYNLSEQNRKDILKKIKSHVPAFWQRNIRCQIGMVIQMSAPSRANFCDNVTRHNFSIDPTGGMHFCCDIPKMPSNRPNILKDGLEKSFLLTLDIVNEIKKQRLTDLYRNENHSADFYTCEYCNKNIESIIKKVRAKDKN